MASSRQGALVLPPSFYRHGGFPAWGVGIALFHDAAREELTLLFEAGGLRTVSLTKRVLVAVPAATIDEARRGRLLGLAKGHGELPDERPPARRGRVVRREAKPPPAPQPAREGDASPDVMDRQRRAPGSYEAGKRR